MKNKAKNTFDNLKKTRNKSGVLLPDSESMSAIIGALKRTFSRSPMVREFLSRYRREQEWFKKDNTKAKKPKVFYKCFKCQQEFNSNNVQVDHIEPVIPVNIPAKHLSINVLIDRLFCDESNLQILCKEHHKEKSKLENELRKEWVSKVKFIVYQTTNKINNKKYIGIHKCQDYDDGYMGSGTAFKIAFSKYGKSNFYRHILFTYDNIEDAIEKEKELVNDEVVSSKDYYNLTNGGLYGYDADNRDSNYKIEVICHETQEVFESITSAADAINISISSIVKILDNPDETAKNLHFFKTSSYNPNITVSFPKIGKSIVHLNSNTEYDSIEKAATALSLNYKSLRNALIEENEDEVFELKDHFFLYKEDYIPDKQYFKTIKKVKCIQLDKTFDTLLEAATFLKHKNPIHGGIAIGKSIIKETKAYSYNWQWIVEKLPIRQ
jgi:hypothetical protein